MSTWSRFDAPWNTFNDSSSWERIVFFEAASLMCYSDIDVDSDHIVVVNMQFGLHSNFSTKVNSTYNLVLSETLFSGVGTESNIVGGNTVELVTGTLLEVSPQKRMQENVSMISYSNLLVANSMQHTEQVALISSWELSTKPNSAYNLGVAFSCGSKVSVKDSVIINESAELFSTVDIRSTNNIIGAEVHFFGIETFFEVDVYSWGRSQKPVDNGWNAESLLSKDWVPENPISGSWKKEDKL